MIAITGPASTISASPRPHQMPQRSPRPARRTSGRNARPDHKKRCIRRSAGLNPAFRPCRVATKTSAQNSAAPRPQATPSKTGVTPNFFDRVSAPLVGSVIAERLRQLTLRFNPRACRADERNGRCGERPTLSQSFLGATRVACTTFFFRPSASNRHSMPPSARRRKSELQGRSKNQITPR